MNEFSKHFDDALAVKLSDWTDPDTELDQIGEALKDELAVLRDCVTIGSA